MVAKPQMHFARFEFKYLLDNNLRREFERELCHFVEFDPFVQESDGHQYFVRSLYYDDPHYTAFYDKVDGVKKRRKFRVRTYSQAPIGDAPVFLEIKGRHNQLIYKHRVEVDLVNSDDPTSVLLEDPTRSDITSQFFFDYYKKQLRPVALIDYWRRPYLSKYDPEFRVTFDSDLAAVETRSLYPGKTDRSRRVKPGYTVMEVKFRHQIPAWFHRLLQAYELRRVSISKICCGLETLELVEDD